MKDSLVWVDLEMTGLDPENHVILEIACIVTDAHLNIVAEGPGLAIAQKEDTLRSMNGWSRKHHLASGLLDRVRTSSHDCRLAENEVLNFVSAHCERGHSPLCGNSVWQDRRFMAKQMPRLEAFLHYRIIDVSSVKELVKRWYPSLPPFKKKKSHLAMNDIRESISEMEYYRRKVFVEDVYGV